MGVKRDFECATDVDLPEVAYAGLARTPESHGFGGLTYVGSDLVKATSLVATVLDAFEVDRTGAASGASEELGTRLFASAGEGRGVTGAGAGVFGRSSKSWKVPIHVCISPFVVPLRAATRSGGG